MWLWQVQDPSCIFPNEVHLKACSLVDGSFIFQVFQAKVFTKTPLCIHMSQSTCEESPAALPSKHTQNMTTVWWMIMPPLSDSHHCVLSRLLDCSDVLIPSVLPKSALASLQSVLITAKKPFRKKKVRCSQNHFVTSHLIWNRWVESSPPAPHLPVFSHFIYSTPNMQCILPLRGPSACNVLPATAMLLEQEWVCAPENRWQRQRHFWCHVSGEGSTTDRQWVEDRDTAIM